MATENAINQGQLAQVFNRCPTRTLQYTVDGRRYTLKPGLNNILDFHIPFARAQNAVPGSQDPSVPTSFDSIVGIPDKTDCSELMAEYLDALGKEKLDRNLLPPDRQIAVERPMATRDYPNRRAGIEAATPGMVQPGRFGAD